jgi:hypothetical protein
MRALYPICRVLCRYICKVVALDAFVSRCPADANFAFYILSVLWCYQCVSLILGTKESMTSSSMP